MADPNTTTFPTTDITTTDNITTTISLTTPASTELISTTTILITVSTTPGPPSHVGAIAGGVIGGIIFLVIIAAVVLITVRRRRRKRKRRKEKLDNLPLPPSVNELEKAEIIQRNKKEKWSKKDKPHKSLEPHYVNEQIGTLKTEKGKSGEPLYLQPEPPKRDLYSGVDGTEYYMEKNSKTTGQEPTEVYSDPDIPQQTETPKPAYINSEESVKTEPRDYENVPPKRTEPPKANTPKEDMEDEEQQVYENT